VSTFADRVVQAPSPLRETPELRRSGELTVEQIDAIAEATAHELLRVSLEEAYAMLDRGDLDGTVAGDSLRSLRHLRQA